MEAISSDDSLEHLDEFEIVDRLHEISGMDIPQAVEEIRSAAVRYNMAVSYTHLDVYKRQVLCI